MPSEEHTDVVKLLRESCGEIRAAAEGLTDVQAKHKPSPEKWSVLDCVEHLVIVEGRVMNRFEDPGTGTAPAANPHKEARIRESAANRGAAIQAPEAARPTGRYATLGEALAAFDAARERTISFAQNKGAELYSIAISHPVFGVLNGVEAMHLAAAHSRRHAEQMREARAAL
jgi:hypothetical protein